MERARIEQFGGMQRNPVEGLKQGPSLLRNLCFDRAGGYLPFAVAPAQPFLQLAPAVAQGILGYDARGVLAASEELGAGLARFVLACGSTATSSAGEYSSSIANEAAVVPRFGAYAQRGSYFGRGLADGSLFIEPLAVRPRVQQDTLELDGTEIAAVEVQSLTFASGGTASRGSLYGVTSTGDVYKLDLDDPDAAPALLASLGGTAVDISYGNGWLVVLNSVSVVTMSDDEFATSNTQSLTDANLRLSWDSRGERFYATGGRLFQSDAVGGGPFTFIQRADEFGGLFGAEIFGAGVVNIDGSNLSAPFSNRIQAAYSEDGGINWRTYRWTLWTGFLGAFRVANEPETVGALSNHVATDGTGTVLVAGNDGSVYKRKDALLNPNGSALSPNHRVEDNTWTRLAVSVDSGAALLAIGWNAGRNVWMCSSATGGIFESSDGVSWTLAGRLTGAVSRLAFDDDGNWYANEVGGGIAGSPGVLGTPAGRYVVTAIAAIPTGAGDVVTDVATLSADITELNPSSLRVAVPETLTAAWLAALTASERDAYLDAVRIYVYIGYDPDFLQTNPEMYLIKILRLGDAPYLLRREATEAVATDALQAFNLLDFRDSIVELHNQRSWFTIPKSYELDLSSATDTPAETVPPVGSDAYVFAGDPVAAATLTTPVGRIDITGGVPITLGDATGVTVDVTGWGRGSPTERILLTELYRRTSVTLSPGDTATVVLPVVGSSGLPNVEVTLNLNGAGNMLTMTNIAAVTPVAIAPYGDVAIGYRMDFFPRAAGTSLPITFRADPFGPQVVNTELQITSEGGPFTVAWSEQGFVNIADPLNYLKLSASTSTRITDLASGPGQTLVAFCDNEIFSIFGDPGLDVLARVENFGVQRLSAVVGHDVETPVARIGNELFCIHRGQVYAVTGEGVSEQPLSLPVDRRDDPFVQVVGDSIHNHVVGLTASGAILRFDVEKQGWFEDPRSGSGVTRLLPRPTCVDSYGARYMVGDTVLGITDPVGQEITADLEFTDVDLGEKNMTKLWRRVRLHSSDDFEQAVPPVLEYRVRDRTGRTTGRLSETGVWVFTFARGVVGPKIDLLFSFETIASSTIEPPVDIEFVPRYVER